MIVRWSRPIDAQWGVPIAALAAFLVLAALAPSSASAVPASGQAAIAPQPGKAKTDLFEQGAKLRGGARGKGGAVVLEVTDLNFGKVTKAKAAGTIVFARGKRRVVVHDIGLSVAAERTTVTGKIGNGRHILLRATGRSESVANAVGLRRAPLALTAKAAKALAPRLGLDAIKPGRLGVLNLSAVQNDLPKEEPKGDGSGEEKPKPDDVVPIVDPYSAQCTLPANAEGATTAAPAAPVTSLGGAPAVASGKISWGFKQSFRIYLATGAEGSATAIEPASIVPPPPGPPSVGTFQFPIDGGEYSANDPGDPGDDQLVADGTGEIVMCAFHNGKGFRITLSNPTVTIDGAESRLAADVSTNITGTVTAPQRVDLAEIQLDDPGYSSDPHRVEWDSLSTTLTQSGLDAMQLCSPGAPSCTYHDGIALDPLTVDIAEPFPLPAACTLSQTSTTSSWPTVPAPPAAAPTLTHSVYSGRIDWGLRTGLRNTVNSSGAFNALDGASLSNPADMSGDGKFFRWPAASGEYEPGTPGKLVLHGTGTIGLCNTKHGYGTALSNPTLVIDGASSRLSLDVASRLGVSWTRFEVDIAALDIGDVDVDATPGPGVGQETISWTFPSLGDSDPNSAVTLAAAGTSALWLVNLRTAGISLNQLSGSAVVPAIP